MTVNGIFFRLEDTTIEKIADQVLLLNIEEVNASVEENIKYKFRFAQKWPIICINY